MLFYSNSNFDLICYGLRDYRIRTYEIVSIRIFDIKIVVYGHEEPRSILRHYMDNLCVI